MKSTPGNLNFGTTTLPASGSIASAPLWLDQALWFAVQIFFPLEGWVIK